jgi:glycosyltransferase involved in cell wall biosynthesis
MAQGPAGSEEICSMTPVSILHVLPEDSLGGVENAARSMVQAADLPCTFRALYLSGRPAQEASASVIAIGARSPFDPFSARKLIARFRAANPDVLICSLWKSIPACLALKALKPDIKLVAFLHADRRVHSADAMLHRILVRVADALWADSAATLARFPHRPRQLRRVVSFITDRLQPLPATRFRPIFVSWGRLHAHKGIERSISLIALLRRGGVEAELDYWGPDQGEGPNLRVLCQRLEVAPFVRFRGPIERPRLREVSEGASFYLQTSHFEGFGMAVTEAMQLGLVPVVTAVGEIATYARDGVNAVVVQPDNLEVTANRIAALLNSPERLVAMRAKALETFADHPLYADDVCSAAVDLVRGKP